MKRCLMAVGLVLLALVTARTARADVTFVCTGCTFTDGATLSGTLTINTTTGVVDGAALTASEPGTGTFDMISSPFTPLVSGNETYGNLWLSDGTSTLGLNFPIASLVGYDGSDLCGNAPANCTYQSGHFTDDVVSQIAIGAGPDVFLASGELQPSAAVTPEPTTSLLFGTGIALIGMATLVRRRKRIA